MGHYQHLAQIVEGVAYTFGPSGVQVVRSSHSVDITAPGVSKRLVASTIAEMLRLREGRRDVLCIGDRGKWPGNDYALLAEPFSLSVDEVSPNPATCWNLLPPGMSGAEAAVVYLRALEAGRGFCRFARDLKEAVQ